MQKTIFLFTTLAALLASPASYGADADSIRQDFYANAQALPKKLLATGYRHFGDLDLGSLLNRLEQSQVPVRVVGAVAHQQALGPFEMERDSAEWKRDGGGAGSISLNGPHWLKTASSAKPMLALHETLGAQGISDDNFACSGSLWALTDPEARSTLNREELSHFEAYANKSCFSARMGGSTGVTGGGDDYNVNVRMKIMRQGLRKIRAGSRTEGLDDIEGNFYQGFAINPHGKAIDQKTFMSSIKLERHPVVSTIHVMYQGRTIPEDSANGWTYDAGSNSVVFHGSAVPKDDHSGMEESPGVLCQWAD